MRPALFFLFSLVVYVAVAEPIGEQKSRQGKQYGYYPAAAAVQPGYNYGYPQDPRLFFARPSTTTTSTTTSTSTVTCTKSVATACTGRKRRGILLDEDDEEQFLISPTLVQGAEATQEPVRESRAASPQLLMYPQEFAQYHPQSGLNQHYNYVPLNYYYEPYYAGPSGVNNRLFFGLGLVNSIQSFITRTFSTTTTIFTVTTSTSTPACYTNVGSLPQCPV